MGKAIWLTIGLIFTFIVGIAIGAALNPDQPLVYPTIIVNTADLPDDSIVTIQYDPKIGAYVTSAGGN